MDAQLTTCGECRFYSPGVFDLDASRLAEKGLDSSFYGECRLSPPIRHRNELGSFPLVHSEGWCGKAERE